MDGLLIDSENNYVDTALLCIKKYNYNIEKQLLFDIMGSNENQIRQMFKDRLGEDFNFDEFKQRRIEISIEYEKTHPIALKKGVKELFNYLDEHNIKKTLATSTNKDLAIKRLKAHSLENVFEYMVTGDMINKSKPDPQIYLKAIEPFNLNKEEILAFEDSNNGILSAYNANLNVIYIPDIAIVKDETKQKVYTTLNDLTEVINLINEFNNY